MWLLSRGINIKANAFGVRCDIYHDSGQREVIRGVIDRLLVRI
jgi:hypothetical protein